MGNALDQGLVSAEEVWYGWCLLDGYLCSAAGRSRGTKAADRRHHVLSMVGGIALALVIGAGLFVVAGLTTDAVGCVGRRRGYGAPRRVLEAFSRDDQSVAELVAQTHPAYDNTKVLLLSKGNGGAQLAALAGVARRLELRKSFRSCATRLIEWCFITS